MSTSLANKIRPTGTPIHCSACFGQYPERRHIDFDAACDRGYGEGPVPIAMDDLVLCEECVREGAQHLGMIDGERWQTREAALVEENALLKESKEEAVAYAELMERTLAKRPSGPIDAALERKRHEQAVERGKLAAAANARKREAAKRG
jgi:hypothetical protein